MWAYFIASSYLHIISCPIPIDNPADPSRWRNTHKHSPHREGGQTPWRTAAPCLPLCFVGCLCAGQPHGLRCGMKCSGSTLDITPQQAAPTNRLAQNIKLEVPPKGECSCQVCQKHKETPSFRLDPLTQAARQAPSRVSLWQGTM